MGRLPQLLCQRTSPFDSSPHSLVHPGFFQAHPDLWPGLERSQNYFICKESQGLAKPIW